MLVIKYMLTPNIIYYNLLLTQYFEAELSFALRYWSNT